MDILSVFLHILNVRKIRLTGKVRMTEFIGGIVEKSLAFLVMEQIEVEEHFTNDVVAGNRTKNAAVARVVPVVAHEEVFVLRCG